MPVRTINAGPSPKYFGCKRGITWLNAVNDQVAGIGQMVVPGTPRDSLFILDTLLNLGAGPEPEVVATGNAPCSDMVFGVFAILNYRFADLPGQRYWRAALPEPLPANAGLSPAQQAIGGYGPLEPIVRNTVNVAKIATQWPDLLRGCPRSGTRTSTAWVATLHHPAACRAAAAARPERTRWRGRRRVLTSPARASRRGTCVLSWPARADVTGTGDGGHGRESWLAAMLDL